MNLRTFPFGRITRRQKWTDDYPTRAAAGLGPARPQSDAESLAAELTDRFAGSTVTVVTEPDRDLLAESSFEDGVAYSVGQLSLDDIDALADAEHYLRTDPVHGARRAALVLAGYVGADVAEVAA